MDHIKCYACSKRDIGPNLPRKLLPKPYRPFPIPFIFVDKKRKSEAASLPLRLLVLTFHTDNLCCGFTLLAKPDYHSGQLTTVDTAGVEAFAVFENIFAALGVMAVDNGRALFLEKFGLFVVPQLATDKQLNIGTWDGNFGIFSRLGRVWEYVVLPFPRLFLRGHH